LHGGVKRPLIVHVMPGFMTRSSLLLPVLAALSACGGSVDHRRRGDRAMRRANYELAYAYYQAAQQENPGDPDTARAARDARIAYLRDQARGKVFAGAYEEAMEDLERVLALDSGDAAAREWMAKARFKAAERETTAGRDAFLLGDLEGALRAYYRALQFVPAHEPAEEGLAAVAQELARRRRKADEHYVQGVRALGESLFGQTYYHMFNSERNDPAREDAARKKAIATGRLAEDRFAFAQESEAQMKWLAALSDYRSVKAMAPDFPGVDAKIKEMEREVEASELTRLAELTIVRGDIAEAIELLQKAYDTSELDRVRMSELLLAAREKERELEFERAKDLAYDHRLEEALELFEKIETRWPGYSNVRARISTLAETIRLVQEAYDRGVTAQADGKQEEAAKAFREVLASWPGYRDAEQRLEQARE
jgi:tetratricopeptide (TPR) repeat protein